MKAAQYAQKQKKAFSKQGKINADILEAVFNKTALTDLTDNLELEIRELRFYCDLNVNNTREHKRDILKYKDLLLSILTKAPKLLHSHFWKGLWHLSLCQWKKEIVTWIPKGKSPETQFYSLVDHLLVVYPVPKFLYSLFFIGQHVDLFVHLAEGGSMYKAIQREMLPVNMTRKMCHIFLSLMNVNFYQAIRYAQIIGMGGSEKLAIDWMNSPLGSGFMGSREAFWAEVMQWFCMADSIDSQQISPLIDYISHCKRENPLYSLKGRTAISLLRNMQEWHDDLAKIKKVSGIIFKPSGLLNHEWEVVKQRFPDNVLYSYWKMEEILTSKRLLAEGATLRHCVYSYARMIEQEKTSIWSLQCDDKKLVTVQVANRQIVQARGLFNRYPDEKEKHYINLWAIKNQLIWVRS